MRYFINLVILTAVLTAGVQAQHGARRPAPRPQPQPVRVVEQAKLYQSGEVHVEVSGNQTPTVRIGMAQGATTQVEFPSGDRVFAYHPGDPAKVTFDQNLAKSKWRFAIFRPGESFVAPEKGHGDEVTMAVQMDSGLYVVFIVYPVKSVSENAHRVVVKYDPEKVVDARRNAGLQVYLLNGKPPEKDPSEVKPESVKKEVPQSVVVGEKTDLPRVPEKLSDSAKEVSKPTEKPVEKPAEKPGVKPEDGAATIAAEKPKRSWLGLRKPKLTPEEQARLESERKEAEKLAAKPSDTVVKGSAGTKSTFTAGGRGLVATAWEGDGGTPETMQVFVEVRNVTTRPLRLLNDNPDVVIETREGNRRVNAEMVVEKQVKGVPDENWLQPNALATVELRFRRPVIGTNQRLVVTVGQSMAADAPVAIDITRR